MWGLSREETMDRQAKAWPWALGLILASLAPKNDDGAFSTALAAVKRPVS
jgi:hypothetical protein